MRWNETPKKAYQFLSHFFNRYPIAAFFLAYFTYSFLFSVFGAPFVTPDSQGYLDASQAPWLHWADWRPVGLPWVLYLMNSIHIHTTTTLILIAALKSWVLFLFCLRISKEYGFLIFSVLFLAPQMLMVDLSLWSESLFILILLTMVYTFSLPIHWLKKGLTTGVLFLFATLARHTAIFILPAAALAMGFTLPSFRGRKRIIPVLFSSVYLFLVWGTFNLFRTGHFLQPVTHSYACAQNIVTYHSLIPCNIQKPSPLCALDPKGIYIGNSGYNTANGLNFLHFDEKSPIFQFTKSHSQNEVCEESSHVLRSAISHHPFKLSFLILKRFLRQFGRFEESERGTPSHSALLASSGYFLNGLLRLSQTLDFSHYLFLAVVLWAYLKRLGPQNFTPEALFLFFSALGHSAGLALNNPFCTIRYQVIQKLMLTLVFLIFVLRANTRFKFRTNS